MFFLLIRHLLNSLIPCIVVLAVGGALGYVCALLVRVIVSSRPGFSKWGILLPWRTLMLGLLYFTSPFFLVRLLGFGDTLEMVMNGTTLLLLAFPFTVVSIVEYWYPLSLQMRLVALARTLATTSLVIGVREVVGFSGAGKVGFYMLATATSGHPEEASMLWLMVVGLVLVVDLLSGILQLILYNSTRKGQHAQCTTTA